MSPPGFSMTVDNEERMSMRMSAAERKQGWSLQADNAMGYKKHP
jgi:hypothetical protein